MRDRYPRHYTTDPFIDLLFNTLLGFTFLFLVTVMFMNPTADKGRINLKAEYIISVTWPDNLAEDIDLWVRDPLGEIVSYLNKDAGWLHLDRDDRGEINDTITVNGKTQIYPINEEVVTIRGIIAGEYAVNLYYYKQTEPKPVEALVKVEKVNPTLQTVFVKKVLLNKQDDEQTIVRFELNDQGEIARMSQLPLVLTSYALDPESDTWTSPFFP